MLGHRASQPALIGVVTEEHPDLQF